MEAGAALPFRHFLAFPRCYVRLWLRRCRRGGRRGPDDPPLQVEGHLGWLHERALLTYTVVDPGFRDMFVVHLAGQVFGYISI